MIQWKIGLFSLSISFIFILSCLRFFLCFHSTQKTRLGSRIYAFLPYFPYGKVRSNHRSWNCWIHFLCPTWLTGIGLSSVWLWIKNPLLYSSLPCPIVCRIGLQKQVQTIFIGEKRGGYINYYGIRFCGKRLYYIINTSYLLRYAAITTRKGPLASCESELISEVQHLESLSISFSNRNGFGSIHKLLSL